MSNLTYGASLPDQFDLISGHVTTHLTFVSDIRDLLKERSALERDYAVKLRAISGKAAERRAKIASTLVLGQEPSRAWSQETLRRSTLDTAYQVFLASLENTARDHTTLADALTTEVTDVLKVVEKKKEDLKKTHVTNFEKLLAERDRIYGERTKAKGKYDDACLTIENGRRKGDNSSIDKHTVEMNTTKNAYIVSIAVANREKDKYFEDDLPVVEDQLQDLQTSIIVRLTGLLQRTNALHLAHLNRLASHHNASQTSLASIAPAKDQDLFIQHNSRPFSMPQDWTFEPCPSHYDTPDPSLEPEAKIFLQNRLAQARSKREKVKPEADAKQRDVANLQKVLASYRENPKLGDQDEVAKNLADASFQAAMLTTSVATLEAEASVIAEALGGDEGSGKPHAFKSSSFSIPTTCAYCNTSIWGLRKEGKTCKACGISVHNKCELKLPPECGLPQGQGAKENGKKASPSAASSRVRAGSGASLSRSGTTASVASTSSAPSLTPSRSSTLDRDEGSPVGGDGSKASVMFAFTASSSAEISVNVGDEVTIVEDDDGTGWVEVADKNGGRGVVPATYLQKIAATPKRVPPPRPSRGAVKPPSGKMVTALYDYAAQTAGELSLKAGERIELTPNGDKDGDWWEGVKAGKKGVFPANYVERA